MKYLILTLVLFSLIACSDDEQLVESFLDCDEISQDYEAYNGQEIGCQFHFVLTEHDNQRFIELVAHCADLTRPFVFDENCVDICETLPYDPTSECGRYLQGRETMQILLIAR